MRRERTRFLGWLPALVFLVGATSAGALELREGFEWDWDPLCVDSAWRPTSCFDVLGCGNGRDLFVRRTNAGFCGYSDEVRFWSGRALALGAPTPPAALSEQANRWVASHRWDPAFRGANGGTFEILTTRDTQSSHSGSLQIDFRVPRPLGVSGAGEHYLIMHNLNLSSVDPCPRDGSGCGDHAGSNVGGVSGNPDSYQWYGVIAGAFGAGTAAIPFGSLGFAIEVSAEGRGGNHLVEGSFLPYSVGGAQQEFPAGWYRVRISRQTVDAADVYSYSVLRWSDEARRWMPIVPDKAEPGHAAHIVRVPFSRLREPLGYEIPTGYVGLSAAWFGAPEGRPRSVEFDNLVVDW